MGRFDNDSKGKSSISITTMFMIILLFSVFFNMLQNSAIGNLEDKLEKIEPIIDHYCMSSTDAMEFCNEVLEGYNDRVKLELPKDVLDDRLQINVGNP